MRARRRNISQAKKAAAIEAGGGICVYCGAAATVVDHLIPYAYSQDNTPNNLVPSCADCNAIAGSLVFESMEAKRGYIQDQRSKPRWQRRSPSEATIIATPRLLNNQMHLVPKPKPDAKPVGRPKLNKRTLAIRLDEETYAQLQRIAAIDNRTVNQLISLQLVDVVDRLIGDSPDVATLRHRLRYWALPG